MPHRRALLTLAYIRIYLAIVERYSINARMILRRKKVKATSAPKVEKGFHFASADMKPQKQFVVYAGTERFSLGKNIEAIGLAALAAELQSLR